MLHTLAVCGVGICHSERCPY